MKYNIEKINEELLKYNWVCLSQEYKNLDSQLLFKCPYGHSVQSSFRRIRENRICPVCMRERLKTKEFKNTKKKKGEYRILALDQATHTSGYAVFNNKNLIDYGSYVASGDDDIERSVDVKQWMISLIDQYEIDFVGLEGIQYQSTVGVTTFETLARLQGILAATCVEEKIHYKIVSTNTWRLHCGVKGRTRPDKKRSMQMLVKEWFNLKPTEDECDAIGIGKYFSDIQSPKVEIINWEAE